MFKKKVNLDVAINCAGWMTYKELEWLAREARKHQSIIEVGSYQGKSTRALADNTPGVVIAIDNFKGPMDISLPTAIRDNLFEIFIYNMADLIETKKVIPIVDNSQDAMISTPADMVFIDGSHEYEAVKKDILKYKSLLIPGGLICGHDYTNMAGVKAAVDELIDTPKIAKGTSIWYGRA